MRVSFAGELGWEIHTKVADTPHDFRRGLAGRAGARAEAVRHVRARIRCGSKRATAPGKATCRPTTRCCRAGSSASCSWDKPDFDGKAALAGGKAARRHQAVRDAGWSMPGECDAPYMSTLWHEGAIVGETTSGGFRATASENPIALGMLRADLAVPGTELEVEIYGERFQRRGAGGRAAVGSQERKNPRMKIILTDGGMGQELIRRSGEEPTPLWSARVLMDEPELVRDLHVDFIRAGARVITINTYSATPERLARDGMDEWFESLQARGHALAAQARDICGGAGAYRRLPAAVVRKLSPRRSRHLTKSASRCTVKWSGSKPRTAIFSCARPWPR